VPSAVKIVSTHSDPFKLELVCSQTVLLHLYGKYKWLVCLHCHVFVLLSHRSRVETDQLNGAVWAGRLIGVALPVTHNCLPCDDGLKAQGSRTLVS
jgi:hypothetical protein